MNRLRICSNEEMRGLDKIAETEMGIGPVLLMENAGRAASEIILRQYKEFTKSNFLASIYEVII